MTVSQEDARREEQLDRYAVLTEPPSGVLQAVADLAAQLCDVPFAAVNLVTADEQRQVAATGFDAADCAREDSLCALVLEEAGPVVVRDASQDPRFAQNALVTGVRGRARLYASAPLVSPEGVVFGRLCVFDEVPRELTDRQRDGLLTLADRVVDVLELRLRGRLLERSLAELTAARDELQRSNEHLTQFAGQITHDLRGPLTAILANAELLAGEPGVEQSEDARGWSPACCARPDG